MNLCQCIISAELAVITELLTNVRSNSKAIFRTTNHVMIGLLSFAKGNQRMLCNSSKKQDIFLLLAAQFTGYVNI